MARFLAEFGGGISQTLLSQHEDPRNYQVSISQVAAIL